ncbi:hypothetical protein BDM02DRAFT_3113929 [Thelephora ganbajun]|uniref:Uncharacterized protein n=1 Tax=Thelephora ganbajun TaxID=370292 RepID=A0ACB6ZIU1_THEGA|nr:hypothetical protein BDM02DRAFT_3113929 [Thelephora ganbajun]
MKMLPSMTAEQRAADLREQYNMVKSRHEHFVEKILPRIPLSDRVKNPDFQGTGETTFLLEGLGLRLNEIEGKISFGGMYRWSPMYLKKDIDRLFFELSELDWNTLRTSTAAKAVFEKLLEDPETRKVLYGESSKKDAKEDGMVEVASIKMSLGPEPQTQSSHDI